MRIRTVSVLAALTCLLLGCSSGGGSTAPTTTSDADFFFNAAAVVEYGHPLSDAERDAQKIAYAMQRIDPCGFIDKDAVAAMAGNVAYYTFVDTTMTCGLAQPTSESGISPDLRIDITTSSTDWDSSMWKDLRVDNITVKEEIGGCSFFMPLGLGDVSGAPHSPEAAKWFAGQYVRFSSSDSQCDLTRKIAASAAKIRSAGLPRLDSHSPRWRPIFTKDVCSVFPALTGFTRYSQTIGSHAGCSFYTADNSSPTRAVTYFVSSQRALDQSWKTEKRDGVDLYIEPGYHIQRDAQYHDCRVAVVAGDPIQPIVVDQKVTINDPNQTLVPVVIPVITVKGDDCERNKQVAEAAAKKLAS